MRTSVALAAPRGRERERGGGRGLANASGPDADQDPSLQQHIDQTRDGTGCSRIACIARPVATRGGWYEASAVKRELIVTADGRDRTVSVEGPLADGRFRISIDGAERIVDARAVRPGTWSLVIDGRSFSSISIAGAPAIAASVGASEVAARGRGRAAPAARAAPPARAAPARGESIRAPIAGKVVKVLVAVGDQVAPGTR